jgi:hypothetical protein
MIINKTHSTNFRYLTLFEDEAARRQLGKDHAVFDENFERNGQPWRWGYILDFNRPCKEGMVDGVNQKLVTRIIGYRLPSGDEELGVTTIAPSGMVPLLSRAALEKMVGASGLKKLEELRGKEIHEKGDEVVDVKNALGYPQFTLDHDYREGGEFIYSTQPSFIHTWSR